MNYPWSMCLSVSYVSIPHELGVNQSEITGRIKFIFENPTFYIYHYKETNKEIYERLGNFRDSKQHIWLKTMNVTFAEVGPIFPGRLNNLGCRDLACIRSLYLELTHDFKFSLGNPAILSGSILPLWSIWNISWHIVNSISKFQLPYSPPSNHFKVNRNRSEAIPKSSLV